MLGRRRILCLIAGIAGLAMAAVPWPVQAQIGGGSGGIFQQAMRSTQQGPKAKTPEDAVNDAKKKIDDVDPRVRVAALAELEGANNPEANAILMREINDPDLRVKVKAIDVLGIHQFKDAVPVMSQELFLRDTPDVVKLHLVAALGRIGDQAGTLPVMNYLDTQTDSRARGTAVFALGEIGNPKAIDVLTQIIGNDRSPMVRKLAQEALAKIDGELPSAHSEELAAERSKRQEPTYDKLAKMRELDQKLQEQNW
jgi:HEAT repeat protein